MLVSHVSSSILKSAEIMRKSHGLCEGWTDLSKFVIIYTGNFLENHGFNL